MKACLKLVALGALLLACQKEEPPPAATEPVPTVPAATTVSAPAEPPIDLESVAVEEDFEEEAEREVTAANLEKKLDELEKEIEAE